MTSLLSHAILRMAYLLVPRPARPEWLCEWQAELWIVLRYGERGQALEFCLGSFRDALAVRRLGARAMASPGLLRLSTPLGCLVTLAILAVAAAVIFAA